MEIVYHIEVDDEDIYVECPYCDSCEGHPAEEQRWHLQHFHILEWLDDVGKYDSSLMECQGCKEKFIIIWKYKELVDMETAKLIYDIGRYDIDHLVKDDIMYFIEYLFDNEIEEIESCMQFHSMYLDYKIYKQGGLAAVELSEKLYKIAENMIKIPLNKTQ